ncbi:DUF1735 domain-containing protein [Pedobacter mucosus]|uniref:DUF1735 domain-containing protein n=1 Tax=Pedobacter mucosus TaxID=2895286 RepID=UPI001EE44F8D|nr:DUF1735 domain-containing protein [Pedobacter mucosus]UKT65352.1 DUF1735 domain-containing protein [Pedobacter mucosus]
MKNNLKIYSLTLAFIACLFSSCVKEDNMFTDDGNGGVNGIVELGDLPPTRTAGATAVTYTTVTKSFDAAAEIDVPIVINYTGVNGAPNDVTVQLGIFNAAVTATNTAYTFLPTTLYTIPSNTVVIPKGQKKATFIIKVKAASFNFALTYALGIQITSASSGIISGNYGTGVFIFSAKNQWDGIYSIVSGTVTRFTAVGVVETPSTLNGSLLGNANITLTTNGANSNIVGNLRWFGGGAVAGIDNTIATINPTTNAVTMSALGNLTLANRAGLPNNYDPATKTFILNFDWNQTTAPRQYSIVLKYVGPRP